MNSRDDAVEYFKKLGYQAFLRDWALGKTIDVPTGKRHQINLGEEDDDGVVMYDGGLYLYPLETGEWAVYDSRDVRHDRDKKYPSLEDAVLAAEKIVRELDTDMEN